MMTPQEVFERDGFLVLDCDYSIDIGSVVEIDCGQAAGACVRIVGSATLEEAERQAISAGWNWPPKSLGHLPTHCYKVIAE